MVECGWESLWMTRSEQLNKFSLRSEDVMRNFKVIWTFVEYYKLEETKKYYSKMSKYYTGIPV